MKDNKLNALNISVMYIGAIMGAGFASGRETWQFFGVFGKGGIAGANYLSKHLWQQFLQQ